MKSELRTELQLRKTATHPQPWQRELLKPRGALEIEEILEGPKPEQKIRRIPLQKILMILFLEDES